MEPDKLEHYKHLIWQCRDIATDSQPHNNEIYPCSVEKTIALELRTSKQNS